MVNFSFLVLHLLADLSLALPSSPTSAKAHNANHIFNAIHSAGRQWHESLHHNGLSFFLATIPAGTHLYHGRGDASQVTGMDWLALEPEHAANFALDIRDGPSDCKSSASLMPQQRHLSPKWTWLWEFTTIEQPLDNAKMMRHPDQVLAAEISTPPLQHIPASAGDQVPLILPTDSQPPPPPNLTLCPGYLHTYTTQRILRLLYIDGMSAAKTALGTLDTQDNILLRQSALRPGRHPADDRKRARGLCELTRTHYAGRIDGFVRMEHGFEVVLCDFESGALRQESALRRHVDGDWGVWSGNGDGLWQFFNAVADRYAGIGGGRLQIDAEGMVSVFAYPDVDVWADGEDGILPNISRIDEGAAVRIAADVRDLVVSGTFPDNEQQQVDWRGVAELYVTRYARRLIYLTSKQIFTSAGARANATRAIYAVYMDASEADDHQQQQQPSDAAIQRCTDAFIPPSSSSSSSSLPSLPHSAISAVAHEICTALSDIMTLPLSHDFAGQQRRLEALMRWLQWPEFKACADDNGRGCAPDELCFVAMWPWGGQADHDTPRCWQKAALEKHLVEVQAREDYWRMGEMR